MKNLKGHCAHCDKVTEMNQEGRNSSWELRWDIWQSEAHRLGNACTLCLECMVMLTGWLRRN